ncbi:MAG: hypothetical protein WKF77_29225 [Planctomycetaceae bacterium]
MEFNIRPAAKCCAKTGQPFRPGDVCWSMLIEKDGQMVRQDFSSEAWAGPPPEAIGHWRSQIAPSIVTSRPRLDADSLFDYFLQLSDSPNIVQQQYRYVLALLLLRKRRLLLEEVVEFDDRPTMRLVGSAGEGPFDVPEEELNEEQIDRLQQQLFDTGRAYAA